MEKKKKKEDDRSPDTNPSPGDPVYGADQDIYSRAKREAFEEDNTDAENKRKTPMPGDGLDIPGAESWKRDSAANLWRNRLTYC